MIESAVNMTKMNLCAAELVLNEIEFKSIKLILRLFLGFINYFNHYEKTVFKGGTLVFQCGLDGL